MTSTRASNGMDPFTLLLIILVVLVVVLIAR